MSTETVRPQPKPERTNARGIDLGAVRSEFPILRREVQGRGLVYLDNAATSQKPVQVLDSLEDYYRNHNANVHRGLHTLAEEATEAFEATRARVARFIGAADPHEVVFTRGTTESINLVAQAWGRSQLGPGDEILITVMEHHSNFVPWILLARQTGATLRHVPIHDDGTLDRKAFREMLGRRTRIVAVTMVSNALGTVNPVEELVQEAHRAGALVLLDGAQGVAHGPVNVQDLECDFLAFSGHKMLGPMGVGVLWARREILETTEPFMGGGEMINKVELNDATWNEVPWKFEAGTPNVAGVVGFAPALDYLESIGMDTVRRHEEDLVGYALDRLSSLGHLTLYGPDDRAGIVSFNDRDLHPHDLSTLLDRHGVAVRAGHHCCQPLMRRLGIVATARASFYVYNGRDDVDALVEAIAGARKYFGLPVS
jgi:cysteine desulfurase/selenocysteine lyase